MTVDLRIGPTYQWVMPQDTQFPDKDLPLRDDVRTLGACLGEVLQEQGGMALYERVEGARQASRLRRQGDMTAEARLRKMVTGLPAQQARDVVRAFAAYFGVVNMAERVHRIRRGRSYSPDSPQPGSLRAILQQLHADGTTAAELATMLNAVSITPVFTAHPTEAIRRTLLTKEQRMARALVDHIDPGRLTAMENQAALERVRDEMTTAWQTAESSPVHPTVGDEAEHVVFFLTDVVYRVVPAFCEELERVTEELWGEPIIPAAPLFHFGTWVGGDMDGNPNVGADTLMATLSRQRQLVLKRYRDEIRQLFLRASHSRDWAGFSPCVDAAVEAYRQRMPTLLEDVPERYHDMPYRMLLWAMAMRVDATLADAPEAYGGAHDLEADIHCIVNSLTANRGQHAGLHGVRRLLRRVQTFGFHLATVDVRQDAWEHRQTIAELLADESFPERPAAERVAILRRQLEVGVPGRADVAHRSVQMLAAIATARQRFGEAAVGPYIISMAQGADDVLAVLYLARVAGLERDDQVPLDVAPLFETDDDLDRARQTVQVMLDDPRYRAHLRARGNAQMVMIGYSDSSKRAGMAASRWALYRAQEELAELALSAQVELTIFHGRGGTVSRGGGKPRQAILASPPGTLQGRLRLTEQGEIIHAKYGLRGIALRTMELMAGATLETYGARHVQRDQPLFARVMQVIAQASQSAFRALVYDDPDFYAYFRAATPIDVIERLRIGSRPASRRQQRGIEDLRAIPWVFAWVQSRHLLTGWYGINAGLSAAREQFGLETLRRMAKTWPFFANLISDAEMVLAKADLGIAAHYADLAGPTGARIFATIRATFEETCNSVCAIRGHTSLLDSEPVLQRVIRLRNPYVDPISLLQLDLLRRWRDSDRQDGELELALFATVRGIARGMQNTG